MKKIFPFLFGFMWVYMQAQETVELNPTLTKAEVYLNDARLFYQTRGTIGSGLQKIVIHGLSPYMIKESFAVKGMGKADIVDIKFRKNYLRGKRESEEIKKLKKQLSDIQNNINAIEAEIESLREEKNLLKANRKIENSSSIAALQQRAQYFKSRIKAIHKAIFKLEMQLKPLEEKEKKLQAQIDQWEKRVKKPSLDAIITLHSDRSQEINLRLAYITRQAYWRPAYTIRSQGNGKPLDWTYKAEVYQNTGIDWNNVTVSLSSYSPHYHLRVPRAEPWYLSPVKSYPVAYMRKAKGEPALMNAQLETDEEISFTPAEEIQKSFDVQYTLTRKYDVLSGNEPTLIRLKKFSTPAEYTYFAVPYKDPSAYLIATVKNLNKYRLLPGRARLYFEDRYTGQSHINPQAGDTVLKLAFGADPEIHIERKRTDNFKDYQLIGGKVTVKRAYEIIVTNHKQKPVEIIIKDRVPVSQDEKIEVKNIKTDGSLEKNGIITWKKTLAPGQKATLHFSFEVKYPKDYQLYF